jgi:hypothetical protein
VDDRFGHETSERLQIAAILTAELGTGRAMIDHFIYKSSVRYDVGFLGIETMAKEQIRLFIQPRHSRHNIRREVIPCKDQSIKAIFLLLRKGWILLLAGIGKALFSPEIKQVSNTGPRTHRILYCEYFGKLIKMSEVSSRPLSTRMESTESRAPGGSRM